jgi:hypothetical protein
LVHFLIPVESVESVELSWFGACKSPDPLRVRHLHLDPKLRLLPNVGPWDHDKHDKHDETSNSATWICQETGRLNKRANKHSVHLSTERVLFNIHSSVVLNNAQHYGS